MEVKRKSDWPYFIKLDFFGLVLFLSCFSTSVVLASWNDFECVPSILCKILVKIVNIYFLMFIYFWESASRGGAEREGQKIWCGLCTDSREPDMGLEPTNHKISIWALVGCSTNWTTQAPHPRFKLKLYL